MCGKAAPPVWFSCGKSIESFTFLVQYKSAVRLARGLDEMLLNVEVPPGLMEGDVMTVEFEGQSFEITVPPGCSAGMGIEVDLPVKQRSWSYRRCGLVVPDGVWAGGSLAWTTAKRLRSRVQTVGQDRPSSWSYRQAVALSSSSSSSSSSKKYPRLTRVTSSFSRGNASIDTNCQGQRRSDIVRYHRRWQSVFECATR